MSERPVYEVHAEPLNGGKDWGLTCPQVPGAISVVRRLADAERHIREAIAFVAQIDADSFDLNVRAHINAEFDSKLQETRALAAQAEQLQRQAAERMRLAVRQLRDNGISGADAATLLGVSPQRVSQLLAAKPPVEVAPATAPMPRGELLAAMRAAMVTTQGDPVAALRRLPVVHRIAVTHMLVGVADEDFDVTALLKEINAKQPTKREPKMRVSRTGERPVERSPSR